MSCNSKVSFNPFTGQFDLVGDIGAGLSLAVNGLFDVDPSSQPGDLVYQSLTIDKFGVVVTDNNTPAPAIGFILDKPTTTTANVTFIGIMDGQSGLTRGIQVWVHTDGSVTSTPPTTDYQQVLGYALSPTEIYFRPEFKRVKLS